MNLRMVNTTFEIFLLYHIRIYVDKDFSCVVYVHSGENQKGSLNNNYSFALICIQIYYVHYH